MLQGYYTLTVHTMPIPSMLGLRPQGPLAREQECAREQLPLEFRWGRHNVIVVRSPSNSSQVATARLGNMFNSPPPSRFTSSQTEKFNVMRRERAAETGSSLNCGSRPCNNNVFLALMQEPQSSTLGN